MHNISNKYSLSMHGFKMKSPARFFMNDGYLYVGLSLFLTRTIIETQRGLGQHGYGLNNLTSMWHTGDTDDLGCSRRYQS